VTDRDPEGLSQACADPGDLAVVVKGFVDENPTGHNLDILDQVMRHYQGKVNPRLAIVKIEEARAKLTRQELAGHTKSCAMDGCQSVPECRQVKTAMERVDTAVEFLIQTKQITTLLEALQRIQREWRPGRRVFQCDPFTVATQALKAYDEYEKLKPND
jgi:hypothetical protein